MASWSELQEGEPELAASVRSAFDATLHHVLATIRADGGPRVSGTEARFFEQDLWLGAMPGSRKVADLRRDQRFALHAAPIDVEMAAGDAKVWGRVVEVTDPNIVGAYLAAVEFTGDPADAVLFRLDLEGAAHTRVVDEELVIRSWNPLSGISEHRRS